MPIDTPPPLFPPPPTRRMVLRSVAGLALGLGLGGAHARAAPLRPDPTSDQSAALQSAIDAAARRGAPLVLGPGTYRASTLRLPDGAHLIGVRGATHLVLTDAASSLITAEDGARLTLSGLTFDGAGLKLPHRRGLVHLIRVRNLAISDCAFVGCGGDALRLQSCAGAVRGNRFAGIGASAIVSSNGAGLSLSDNDIADCADNGIEILRDRKGEDGAQILANRIRAIRAGPGGSGQHGNAIVVYRAGGVIVANNTIRDCAYSAVRANSTTNIQIIGNNIADAHEVAIYSEFSFDGSLIADNVIEGAAIGISLANFNEGGRLAIVRGNLIRNLRDKRPEGARDGQGGIGIYAEADTLISANVVENAPLAGLFAGWGKYLRDVSITGNLVRQSGIGVAVSADREAGAARISENVLAQCRNGAIVGMDHARPVTGDLANAGAKVPQNIALGVNQIRK